LSDATEELNRLATFLGRDLEIVDITLQAGLLIYFTGTVVTLTIEQESNHLGNVYRYGMNAKPYVVVSVSEMVVAGQADRSDIRLLG
jgi:hypothetical protein